MAKITANGARETARWVGEGGETYVLTTDPKGRTKMLHKWTKGAGFAVAHIPVGHRENGRAIYTERPTVEQADEWARSRGFERAGGRR